MAEENQLLHCHLSYQGLRQLPELSTLSNKLVRLDLSHNFIVRIPSFAGLPLTIRELWLNDNPLESLDSSIGLLTNLRYLDVSWTELKKIPAEVGSLKTLNEFKTSECFNLKSRHEDLDFIKQIGWLQILNFNNYWYNIFIQSSTIRVNRYMRHITQIFDNANRLTFWCFRGTQKSPSSIM